ncbi:MAG TPA: Calx-beta domain-containing protein, partial [Pirellulales bacterium]|nr:Calx-beta domain-containing protein [Pirellulales bacterium]
MTTVSVASGNNEFTISLSQAPTSYAIVGFSFSGSAVYPDTDWEYPGAGAQNTGGEIGFPAGTSSEVVSIPVETDNDGDASTPEQVTMSLAYATVDGVSVAVASSASISISEGGTGTTSGSTVAVTVSLSPDPIPEAAQFTADISVSGLTASATAVVKVWASDPADLAVTATNSIAVTNGHNLSIYTALLSDDGGTTAEPPQSLMVSVSVDGASASASAGIAEDADVTPTISISSQSATEPTSGGTTTMYFPVTISPAPQVGGSVDFSTVDGTAVSPTDYSSVSNGVFSFTAGQTSGVIPIVVKDDIDVTESSPQQFTVTLTLPVNAVLGTQASATGSIYEDQEPTLTVSNAAVTEPTSGGTTTMLFTVSISPSPDFGGSVDFSTVDGTAVSPTDYNGVSNGVFSFTAGQTTGVIPIVVKDDIDVTESSPQQFTVTLTQPVNTVLGTQQATGSIYEDQEPTLTVSNASVTEPTAGGTTSMLFTVSISPSPDFAGSVDFSTVDGSATSPKDYNGVSNGVFSFTAGQTTGVIPIVIKDDIDVTESSPQQFTVMLTQPANVVLGRPQATGTINEDQEPTLTINNATVDEETITGGTTLMTFPITITPAPDVGGTVIYNTADGNAKSPTDYDGVTNGTFAFTAGQTTGAITVVVKDDGGTNESDQSFTVTLTQPAGVTPVVVLKNPTATGTLKDKETVTVPDNQPSYCTCSCSCGNTMPSETPAEGGLTNKNGGAPNAGTSEVQSAKPHPIITVDDQLSPSIAQAADIKVELDFGALPAQTIYYSPANYSQGETVVFSQQVDAGSLSSGRVPWTMTVTEEYANSANDIVRAYTGGYNLRNLDNSPFGAGWMLQAQDQLYPAGDGSGVDLADGSGNMYWFASNGSGEYVSPANAPGFATLAAATGGGYTLTDKQGNVENFDASGNLLSKVDPDGNKTQFTISGGLIQQITDPEGRTTTFTYDTTDYTQPMVSSVTDIDGRTTSYTYQSVAGHYQLASITRPAPGNGEAQPVTTFGYDATTGLETSMTNADGTTTFSYNAFRGVSQVTSPDGTKTDYTSPLTQSLVDTSGGNGTQANPAALVSAANLVGTVTVENYNPITSVTTLQTTTYTTGLNGEITSSTDPLGNTTTTQYNAAGQPIEIDGPALSSGPDAGKPNITTFEYDGNGNLTFETLPDGSVESWAYDPTWNEPTSFTDPLGRVTDYSIDPSNGNVLSMTEVGGSGQPNRVTSYTYTPAPTTTGQVPGGLVATETDPRGLETSYAYNTHGMVTATTYAVGTTDQASVSYTYDSQDNLKTETDELGRTTTYGYDGLGRLIEVDAPAPNAARPSLFLKTTYVYDALGRKTSETVDNYNPLTSATPAATTNYYYEATGDENAQVTKVVQPDLTTLTYLYDGADNLLKETDALGRVTEYQYDADNRHIAQQDPSPVDGSNNGTFNRGTANGPVTTVQYDALGNVIAQIDANGNETDNVYDLRGNLLSTTGAAATSGGVRPITSYSYDADQEVVSQSDALGRLTYFQYDPFGEMTLRQDPSPDGGKSPAPTSTSQYDADGNLISETDPNGNTTQYLYDNRNRQTEAIEPSPDGTAANPTTTNVYDAAGELTQVTDPLGRITQYQYDGAGELTATVAPNLTTGGVGDASTTTSDLYDLEGNKVRETDPQGNATTYAYDIMNRLTSVTQPAVAGQSPVTSYQYDADGEVTKTIDPLLRIQTESYDGLGRLASEVDFTGVTTSYSYDLLSQMVHSVETGGTLTAGATTNVYDNLGRLTSTTDAKGGVTSFGYDLVGNRTSLTDSVGNTSSWQFDGLNRVTEESLPTNGTRTYQYDLNGNLLQATDANGRIIQYQYDHLNRQTTETWLAATAVVSTVNDTVQKVVLPAGTNGGLWELAYGETSITAINYNANAAQVQAAIEGITTASGSHPLAGRVSVTGSGSSVDPFVIQFTGATTDTAEPVLTAIFTGLTGGSNYDPNNSGLFLTTAPAAGYNQQQVVGYVATGSSAVTQGNFTLSFGGDTTAALPYNATPQQVQTALAGLASIGSGHVTVNGPSAGQIGVTGVDLYTVTFTDLLGGEAGLPAITIQSQGLADSLGQTSDVQTESWIVAPPAQASGAMQQVVVTAPAGGTFDLSFKGDATGALAQGISAAQLQTALAALASVGSGNVLVMGSGTTLDP